uniref:DNA-directed RNA polymerase subunit beta n=1 Tax=Wickerhamiella domercqiae TaxID=45788 RepID=A0A0N7IS34_WICDO|nr:RNA polymerase I second largest subunit [Wickerhamiella domercqiae]
MADVGFHTLDREARWRAPPESESPFKLLHDSVRPHVDSFDAMLEGPRGKPGLLEIGVREIGPKVVFDTPDGELPLGNKLTYWIDGVSIARPTVPDTDKLSTDRRTWPAECRERLSSYKGRLSVRLGFQVNDGPVTYEDRDCGQLPIMLRSRRCHLKGLSQAELVAKREETEEMGGYFIVNGIEKLIRMLIVQRRNHAMAIERSSFTKRGPGYTQYGIQVRCVRDDQSSQTNVLHYLSDGQVTFRFSWRKNEYLIPVVMIIKALSEINDRQIFNGIIGTDTDKSFLTDRLELMLRSYKAYKANTRAEALAYLGDKFRVVMNAPADLPDVEVGELLLRKIVLVHLGSDARAKQEFLFFSIRKLYALVAGECCADNPDAAQHQEILLPGLLYSIILKEKLEEYLLGFRDAVRQALARRQAVNFSDKRFFARMFARVNQDIGKKMQYFISTGNLVSPTGLDLQQTSGYTVVAERINFHRFLAHFRMVHRGSFFAELKTTTVRKLLPESWGFLCPVHTPDGSPCGLLNHLAHKCHVVTSEAVGWESLEKKLRELGLPAPDGTLAAGPNFACVQLNGRVVGYTTHRQARILANTLRVLRVKNTLPRDVEVGYVPPSAGGQFPGLYLFTGLARMTRPVKHLGLNAEDWVGPFEQPYMNIAVAPEEIEAKVHTHVEFSPTDILSILANMTPYSDFNQSPRNMYQCQMGKQTMGTPGTALTSRSDNKLYQLQTGQSPIVRAKLYDDYGLDEFPNGTNAVVAVISYTGYDMDDAMILNKSAVERGFGHGSVYKTEVVDLGARRRPGDPISQRFGFGDDEWPAEWRDFVDSDGLPVVGTLLKEGDPIAAYFDELTGRTKVKTYKSSESAHVDEVKLLNDDLGRSELQSVAVKLRVDRRPNIGDKFSSRHGQKGVCSQKWPAIDMPFSESGMQPDIIINPHAFPSRMTIGMFVESLAGKAGALHGFAQDCTPWQFSENQTAADYFGEQLRAAGYNYHGNEPMYSGVTGEELRVDIYIGLVFYQRLRHMVNDKFQVRSTGAVNRVTMQPVKGRKRGGGIRVGEMERDAFLGHGTAFLLQDRLLNCSDYTKAHVCRQCGSLLSTQMTVPRVGAAAVIRCRHCANRVVGRGSSPNSAWEDAQGNRFEGGDDVASVAIPFVLRYLDSELAAMGIRMRFQIKPR